MWNEETYLENKKHYEMLLKNGFKNPFDLMVDYQKSIVEDDFELSKAITEILRPLNFQTAETHRYIESLN